MNKIILSGAIALSLLASFGGAAAADLYVPQAAAPVAAPASDWEGLYVGVFGGYSAGTLLTDDVFVALGYEEEYEGFLLGARIGYNFYLTDSVVGGFEVDFAYNDATTSDPSYVLDLPWTGSATARIGLDMGGFVPYVLGGVSFASASITDMGAGPGTDSAFHVGYVVGAGGEIALSDTISANLEYRYTNYGMQSYPNMTNFTAATLDDHSIRAGLNFRLN